MPRREPTATIGSNGRRTRPFPTELQIMQQETGKCCVPLVKSGRPDERCRKTAGWSTNHTGFGPCKFHGGLLPAVELNAAKLAAYQTARSLADEMDMDPLDAMLWCVRLAAGAVSFYQSMLNEIPLLEDYYAEHEDNQEWFESASAQLTLIVSGIGDLYGKERDRLAKTAEMCIRAGLAERQVSLAERQGDLVAVTLLGVIDDLELDPAQKRKARQLAAARLLAIPTTAREIIDNVTLAPADDSGGD